MKLLLFSFLLPFFLISVEIPPEVVPYLLPEDHPIKPKLDKLFSKQRYTEDLNTLFLGGFRFKVREKWDQIIVAKHKKLKGVILKLYTDKQELPDWQMWVKRIVGANQIRQAIDECGYEKYFKVPRKWIYMLPENSEHHNPRHFILVAEDMRVKSSLKNEKIWKNSLYMTLDRMNALFHIMQTLGLNDSVYIDNVPFTSDFRQAFIDTEHYGQWPVHFDRLLHKLPKVNRDYWQLLMSGI